MGIEIHQISVQGSVERLAHKIGLGIWDGGLTRSQNYGMLGQTGAIGVTLLHK